MSVDANPRPPLSPREYTPERGEHVAMRYASGEPGTTLAALHRADPDAVPEPLVVRRWRRAWPAFDALMVEAEQARAAAMMEATLDIADGDRLAASAKNAIAARWRMAEALDPSTFGQRRILAGDAMSPLRIGAAHELTDAELLAIASGRDPSLLLTGAAQAAGDAEGPPCPPLGARPGFTRGSEVIPPSTNNPPGEDSGP